MIQLKTLAVGVTMAIACVSVFAQAASTPRADKREALQAKRIEQGASSGQLTTRETNRLNKEQEVIGKAEDKAKADGTVTNKERAVIHHMQRRASRDVARQKHDSQTAASAP
jgi:hypothetical protein